MIKQSLLDKYPKGMKSESQRNMYTFMFTAALFTTAKIQKQSKCPDD